MRIPVAVPDLGGNEALYVQDAIKSSWISSSGPYLERFEAEYARLCSVKHAIAVSNGTVALHVALAALGIRPGDEVIVPSLTYVATANAATYLGATPVFVDADRHTWCIDPLDVSRAITPRTRAIIAVHLYGQPADMDSLRAICTQHNIALVEDAAEAPTATYHRRPTGGLGDVGTFSFYGNKIFTSGEGGAVTLDDDDLAARIRLLKGQGMDPERRYWFPVVGYNYRLTNVAAAILCAQLERRSEILYARHRIFERYEERLSEVPGLTLQADIPGSTRAPWLFSVLVDPRTHECTRDQLAQHLQGRGIDSRPFFVPIHTLPPYQPHVLGRDLSVSEELAERGLNLPTFPGMSLSDVDLVCDEVVLGVGQ